jgi:hypothetical protein
MDLYYLIYSSVPAKKLSAAELEFLLSVSRAENKTHQITGMLVCLPENYVQLIEGSEEAVKRLYQNIVDDVRHHQVTTLREGRITDRFFPDWSMGFDCDEFSFSDYTATFNFGDDQLFRLLDILDTI